MRNLSPALASIESIAAGSIVVPSERRCVHTAWLCPPAVLADPRHAQALVRPLASLPRGTLLQRGPSAVVFSRMCTDSWCLPFPSLLAASSAAGRGTPAGGVVCTVYLLPPESWVQVVLSSSHSSYISPSQWASQGLRSEMWTWIFVVMCLVETKPQLSPQRGIKRAYYVATYE